MNFPPLRDTFTHILETTSTPFTKQH
uniref:Uncharacterized protein n=1 Tax=Anguilla anguilla TaxID=7936 RepID=A0A0E9UKE7_ANGAN